MENTAKEARKWSSLMDPITMKMPVLVNRQEIFIHSVDTGCSLEELPRATDDWDGWSQGNPCCWLDLISKYSVKLSVFSLCAIAFWEMCELISSPPCYG